MTNKMLIYDAENNTLMRYGLKTSRIDICDSHTIIYGERKKQLDNDIVTLRLPWSLKSICFQGDTVLVYWLNDFYAIIKRC
jgi:hypothetical protein